jgi:hypothetical protein
MTLFFELLKDHKKIFFCDEEMKKEIERRCNTQNTRFIIRDFNDLEILKKYGYELWENHLEYDAYEHHTAELGIIWANKKEFVREALEEEGCEWGCWVDAGSIRDIRWAEYIPDFLRRETFKVAEKGVYMQSLKELIKKEYYVHPEIYIAGAIILFHKDYIKKYCELYNEVLDSYIKEKKGITMDQYIMASIACKDLDWIKVINIENEKSKYIDDWFFFFGKF